MATTRGLEHRGPAQVHSIDRDVILLRKVDFKRLGVNIVEMLKVTALRPGEYEGDQPWFLEGYVSVDQPRDFAMSKALLEATKGFAIARTDTGEVVATFARDQLERASGIAERARAEVAVNILAAEIADGNELDEEEEDLD